MSEPLLRTEGLARHFGGIVAVADIDMAVAAGELRCIIGPNGAGKSTFFNMIAGSLKPSAGRIRFAGQEMAGRPVHAFARLGIARKFQVPSLFPSMSVAENLDVAARSRAADRGQRIEGMLAMLGLGEAAALPAGALAHGQKQWLEIGMALMAEPQLLLLDEPTAGMTVEETERTARLLLEMKGRITIVVIEHDMRFVRALACPTTVMHQGRILAEGPFEAIERDETVRDVYLGRQ
jgi:branched-chain amino acid transport system ATP-binding protein/urea transport system ATP-binding protein